MIGKLGTKDAFYYFKIRFDYPRMFKDNRFGIERRGMTKGMNGSFRANQSKIVLMISRRLRKYLG